MIASTTEAWRCSLRQSTSRRAIIESIAVLDLDDTAERPRVTLFASDPTALEAFAPIRARGETVSLADLARDEVFLNAHDAARTWERPRAIACASRRRLAAPFRVRDVVEFDGAGTDGPAVLAPLATAQRLLGVPGLVEHLLISNRGDELSGATLSDEVVAWLSADRWRDSASRSTPRRRTDWSAPTRRATPSCRSSRRSAASRSPRALCSIFLIFVMLAASVAASSGFLLRDIGTRRGHPGSSSSSKASRTT